MKENIKENKKTNTNDEFGILLCSGMDCYKNPT